MKAKCPNLRVMYYGYDVGASQAGGLKELGYPKARIVCKKRAQFCTCSQAVKAGLTSLQPASTPVEQETSKGEEIDLEEEEPEKAPEPPAAAQEETPRELSMEDLQEIGRQARRQKRQNLEEARAMFLETAKILAAALMDQNPEVLYRIVRLITYQAKDLEPGKWRGNEAGWRLELCFDLGKRVAERIHSPDPAYDQRPEHVLWLYNKELKEMGLKELQPALTAEEMKNG